MSQQFAPGTVLAGLATLFGRGQRFGTAIVAGAAARRRPGAMTRAHPGERR